MNVFVSVGTGLNPQQEAFVSAIEARLRAVGLIPCTIGRNTFSADAPLHAVVDLMDRCAGAVVIALERYRFTNGVERRGSAKERSVGVVALPTPWNQIEAAMAYSRGLPLLVLVDESLRCDGLLEKGNDWYVLELALDPTSLNSPAFSGVVDSWRDRVRKQQQASPAVSLIETKPNPGAMSVAELLGALKPAQLWAAVGAFVSVATAAFVLGMKLTGKIG
nr:hypothetical protein [uncultured Rhodopila sp.]